MDPALIPGEHHVGHGRIQLHRAIAPHVLFDEGAPDGIAGEEHHVRPLILQIKGMRGRHGFVGGADEIAVLNAVEMQLDGPLGRGWSRLNPLQQ